MKPLKISLGCGMRKPEGFVGLDIRPFKETDFVCNIGKEQFPFENDTAEYIEAIHLFEHFYPEELLHCVDECWRVLKSTGVLHIEVPLAGTLAYYIHPDHKIQFLPQTFGFWQVPAEGVDLHGYTDRFWHVSAKINPNNKENIIVDMYPNKPGCKYPYKEIKKYEETR